MLSSIVIDTRARAAVTARGEQLRSALREAVGSSPHVKEVRGSGLLVGIQLDIMAGPIVEVRPRRASHKRASAAARLTRAARQACRAKGLLIITAGKGDIIRLVPPLNVSAKEVDQAVAILKEAIMALPA